MLERPLFEPPALIDLDPSAGGVEVHLEAVEATHAFLPDRPTGVWAYRDASGPDLKATVPGPLLRAKQGDRVVVKFTNRLPVPTTIHWHGLRLPNDMDGTTASQRAVAPGESFEYRFVAGDAGSFWYHPHVAADEQIERGLYAPFVVEDLEAEPFAVEAERYLVLDDVKVEADGSLSTSTDALDLMMGRSGNVVLVNGQREPEILARPGSRERWRLVNAANGRYFQLELEQARFRVIGWDGGLIAEPYEVERLLVAPGERYDVLVEWAGEEGDRRELRTVHYDRGHDMPDPGPKRLLGVVLAGGRAPAPPEVPAALRAVPRLSEVISQTPLRRFVLSEQEEGGAGPRFFINGESWPFNRPVMVSQGQTEVWEIHSDTEMDHPFHLHGMFFEVLERGGVPELRRGWKDTVNVPAGQTVRFSVTYTPLGMWMFHCHILEHAERGMMGEVHVMP